MTKQQLAAKIWSIANDLLKHVKAAEHKDYIIGFMFYRFLSVKEEEYLRDVSGEDDLHSVFEDIDEADIKLTQDHIGYFIAEDDLFSTWRKKGVNFGAKEVSEAIDHFEKNTADEYREFFKGIFNTLRNSLSKLSENAGSRDKAVRAIVDLINDIPSTNKDYDVLGYIYEYLIGKFSSEAKKDGAFYSPHELCECISKYIAYRMRDRDEITVYDPTVGSGGLLLTLGKEASQYMDKNRIKYWGQELISETANLTKMNLFMQGIPVQNICVRNGNTLERDWPFFDEQHSYQPLFVDAVTSNPPYSAHYEPHGKNGSGDLSQDPRFRNYGLAPESKADFAFLLHCLYHLKPDGVMGIVLPHGVLFRGGSEGEIRKNLIKNHNIEAIVGYPSGLFFATGIPVVTIFLSKNRESGDVLFIDASQSFKKDKKQNVLRKSDVQRIFDALKARKDIPGFARLVSKEEIEKNDYNLNIPRYVSAAKEEIPHDLYSVMTGHVSEEELYSVGGEFFENVLEPSDIGVRDAEGYYALLPEKELRENVKEKCEPLVNTMKAIREDFMGIMSKTLIDGTPDKDTYHKLTETLFSRYDGLTVIDKYKMFEAFAEQWTDIENDLARIWSEGRDILRETEPNMVSKKDPKTKKVEEVPCGVKGKIFPLDLIASTYCMDDMIEIDGMEIDVTQCDELVSDTWENMDQDHKEAFAKDDTDGAEYDVKKLKAAAKDGSIPDDIKSAAADILAKLEESKTIRKKIKEAEKTLDEKTAEKIQNLTDAEIDGLLTRKWVDPVIAAMDQVTKSAIEKFISELCALEKKYPEHSEEEMERVTKEFSDMCGELTGKDSDMQALKMLVREL